MPGNPQSTRAGLRVLTASASLAVSLMGVYSPAFAGDGQSVSVNIAGWQAAGFYGLSANSSTTVHIPAGAIVTSVEWIDVSFTCLSGSWQSDIVLSVNDGRGSLLFWDQQVTTVNADGTYTGSGVFDNPGLLGSGPYLDSDGVVFVTVYDTFEDNGIDEADEVFTSGTLVISYDVPPAPICLADVASDASDVSRTPNSNVGPEDLEAFVNGYIADNAAIADVASDSSDTGYNPNGTVGPEDLEAFINAFIGGC